ncbi:MAG: hypothetical protein U5L06_12590 [Rhodovibrio sp.]|nr:hypothetical protein [Rhodovibrio sp.]
MKEMEAAEDPDRNDDPAALFAVDIALTPRTGDTGRAQSSRLPAIERIGTRRRILPAFCARPAFPDQQNAEKPDRQNLIAKRDRQLGTGLRPADGPATVERRHAVEQLKVTFNELGVPTDLTYSDDSARGPKRQASCNRPPPR